jgi:beta-mannosidase
VPAAVIPSTARQEIDLTGDWSFRQIGGRPRRVTGWLPARVPGTVHTDLLAAGRIEDPFYRLNELDQQWVGQADWLYRRAFAVPAAFVDASRVIRLEFDGLDTIAAVRLNGRRIGGADNMFVPWRFDVTRTVRPGRNVLEVEFASAARVSEERAGRFKRRFRTVFFPHRMHIRKAQYAGGWDWGPCFLTAGIWRPCRLVGIELAEIRDVHLRIRELSDRRAVLDIVAELDAYTPADAKLSLDLTCRTTGRSVSDHARLRLKPGTRTVRRRLVVDAPRRWWPAGMGHPALHDLRVELRVGDRIADERSLPVGLRTVELVREKDPEGESFRFRVNGRDLFAKGANWIPGDSFLPKVTREHYRARLTAARNAHMNMIRVWGGGVYEDPTFYQTCDELGLMVWQDFMFACSEYPDDAAMCRVVRREAELVVRRLRNHPSIVIWCGNNENEWLYERRWPENPRFFGRRLFHDVLPGVCRRLDPSRPYWPGSPWGGEKVNDPTRGNQHVWTVWSFWDKPHTYRDWPARFVTEFGFQGMPDTRTVRSFTEPADRRLFSPVLDHHQRMDEGHPRMMKYLAASLGVPRDVEDYVYLSQVLQADVIRIGVEHWRRRWPMSAGALYWQLNDCWPVMSWSAIDCEGRPKALWYASRRFFAPTLVSVRPVTNTPYGLADLEVWVTHEGLTSNPATVEISAWSLNGDRLSCRNIATRLPAGTSQQLCALRPGDLRVSDPRGHVVAVRLISGKDVLSQGLHCFAPDKHLAWERPRFRVTARREENGIGVTIEADRPARAVQLEVRRNDGHWSDNFIDLLPGQPREVSWTPEGGAPRPEVFRRDLVLRTLPAPHG